jgi:hypothetical protein
MLNRLSTKLNMIITPTKPQAGLPIELQVSRIRNILIYLALLLLLLPVTYEYVALPKPIFYFCMGNLLFAFCLVLSVCRTRMYIYDIYVTIISSIFAGVIVALDEMCSVYALGLTLILPPASLLATTRKSCLILSSIGQVVTINWFIKPRLETQLFRYSLRELVSMLSSHQTFWVFHCMFFVLFWRFQFGKFS